MPLDLNHMLDGDGPVARRLGERYEPRPQQAQMVHAVSDALIAGESLLVEAGTGVGKSFAYLLPAIDFILRARDEGKPKRVVVSTHTINLQEQLIEKDIPLLRATVPAAGGDEFTAVLVKGRGNYLSRRRFNRAWERKAGLFETNDSFESLKMIMDWIDRTDEGSITSLPQLPASDVWEEVRSDGEDCLGRRCPTFEKCFYQQARRRMENADLLVVNHALFFADLAMRSEGFGVLPEYHAVVLDEAHTVEDTAADYFGLSSSRYQVGYALSRLYYARRGRAKGALALMQARLKPHVFNDTLEVIDKARHARDVFFEELLAWYEERGSRNGRLREPQPIDNTLSPILDELVILLRRMMDDVESEDDRLELRSHIARFKGISGSLDALLQQSEEDHVYWLECDKSGRTNRVRLASSPIDVGSILRAKLFSASSSEGDPVPVILTSATLATGKHAERGEEPRPGKRDAFDHIRSRVGAEEARALQLGSPFDYQTQAELIIDRSMPEPSAQQFEQRLMPAILHHIDRSDGGAFVLFTSYALLRRAADYLRMHLRDRDMPLLVHGDGMHRSLLLEKFRENPRSVLLGTDSFWQGVDVQGDGLRNVIITRLPFMVPDRPLVEARVERIEDRGGRAFTEYSLPEAILKFKQGFGRLIRSKSDRGTVVVLDSRVVTKPYGRQFVEALPPLPVRDAGLAARG